MELVFRQAATEQAAEDDDAALESQEVDFGDIAPGPSKAGLGSRRSYLVADGCRPSIARSWSMTTNEMVDGFTGQRVGLSAYKADETSSNRGRGWLSGWFKK
uniref:Uncharacterized protein n=1 Tax=Alexandrium andersonii TaxID=327968 RepID=A0A7S2GD45_9DINO